MPSQGSAEGFAAVERFVRDVLPSITGGPCKVTASPRYPVLIRRAAKDRGLSIRTLGDEEYLYDGQLPVGGLKPTTTTLNSPEAIVFCRSKDLTKQALSAASLPTPAGIVLHPDQFDEALAHVRAMSRPSVLKPSSGKQAKGVTCAITTEDDLRTAWETAMEAGGRSFILEEQIEGIDIRVVVIGRRVVAAAARIPSHVVGDGKHSLAQLIDLKQRQRDQNAFLAKAPLTVETARLVRAGRTLDDVPVADEIVVLTGPANVAAGGENVDVTDLVHPDLLRLAVEATRAVPGLGIVGVDLMAPDLGTVDGAVILELNDCPGLRTHHNPAYGKPRDLAGAIIDGMIAAAGGPARSPSRRRAQRLSVARRLARAARRLQE